MTGNIAFAGRDAQTGDCNNDAKAFKGKYLTLGDNDVFTSEAGKTDTIKGLCYVDGTANAIGFVETSDAGANLTKVAFDDVYFKLTGSNASVGVVMLDASPYNLTGISVVNSEFEGTHVGAITGLVNIANNETNISNITLSGVNLIGLDQITNHVGGVFGRVNASQDVTFTNIVVDNIADDGSSAGTYHQKYLHEGRHKEYK